MKTVSHFRKKIVQLRKHEVMTYDKDTRRTQFYNIGFLRGIALQALEGMHKEIKLSVTQMIFTVELRFYNC